MKISYTNIVMVEKPSAYRRKISKVTPITVGDAVNYTNNLETFYNESFGALTIRQRVALQVELIKWQMVIEFTKQINRHLPTNYHQYKQPIMASHITLALIEFTHTKRPVIKL